MEDNPGTINIGGSVGPGAAVGENAQVIATNIAGRDIYLNVPRPIPPSMPKLIVGRSTEAKKLEKLLTDNRKEHITVLTGPRGVGKTTLAAFVVNRLLFKFPDCLWADLAEYRQEPVAVLKRFIRQLGQNADGLDKPDAAASFLKGILSNLRVTLVLDNVEQPDELKYFKDLVNQTQSTVLIITNREDVREQISSEFLHLDPLKEKDAINLFQKISSLPSSKHSQAFQIIINFCHRIPGLLCPIASQIRSEGIKGLQEWEARAGEKPSDLSVLDSALIFRSLFKDLSNEMQQILKVAVMLNPAKLRINMISPLLNLLSEQDIRTIVNELAHMRFLREIEAGVYEPDFLLRSNAALLMQPSDAFEELSGRCHDIYITRIYETFAAEEKNVIDDELKDAKILFGKAVAEEKWGIVRRYVEIASKRHLSQFSVMAKNSNDKISLLYGFDAEPFPEVSIKSVGSNIMRINAPGGSGESIHIVDSRVFFINLNGCRLEEVRIVNSIVGNIELNGAVIEELRCVESTLSNTQMKGAHIEEMRVVESKILGLNLRDAVVEELKLVDSIGSDWDLSNGLFPDVRQNNSLLFEVRTEGSTINFTQTPESITITADQSITWNSRNDRDALKKEDLEELIAHLNAAAQTYNPTDLPERESLLLEIDKIQKSLVDDMAPNSALDEDGEAYLKIRLHKIARIAPGVFDNAPAALGAVVRNVVEKAKEKAA